MFAIRTQNKLKENEEHNKVFWDGRWRTLIVFADLSETEEGKYDYKYEYWVA